MQEETTNIDLLLAAAIPQSLIESLDVPKPAEPAPEITIPEPILPAAEPEPENAEHLVSEPAINLAPSSAAQDDMLSAGPTPGVLYLGWKDPVAQASSNDNIRLLMIHEAVMDLSARLARVEGKQDLMQADLQDFMRRRRF